MQKMNKEKDVRLLEKRFTELSRIAYQRDIITYSDFLDLYEQNILHTLPKDLLSSRYISFGGYDMAERQMAAFIPDALYLRYRNDQPSFDTLDYPFDVLKISPLNRKFSDRLCHRDYLGAVLNLGIERCKIGDILADGTDALIFVHRDLKQLVCEELVRVRHTSVVTSQIDPGEINLSPEYREIRGTVASVRLDSLLGLAFSTSRSRMTGLVESAKVYVNGRLVTSNGYQLSEGDVISVRGMGKFRYAEEGSCTKKNRISVIVHRYV
ncbi:YlmH family RNA-binding protein [Clostridium sp. Marseille-P3244]|uniref:YlmH family RNA-binding protein n=1 Tax=Clostridium sp. Marseille-P3244 TaxID=1871020 RepID=UPI000931858A|nr:YlmH/Sll1252 family protein [Clostridium sp. Marseille-P3244]